MKRPLRILVLVLGAAALIALAVTTAASLWLSSWVTTNGKAWLEAELEQQGPLDIDIRSLRYSLWKGLLCEEVTGVDRQTHALWIHAPSIRAHVGLLGLLANRIVPYQIKAELAVPANMTLMVEGQYRLRDRQGVVEIASDAFALETLSPLVKQHAKGLQSGTASLKLRANWQPGAPPEVAGRLRVSNLRWHSEALPFVGMTEEMSGSFRLSGGVLTIDQLQGQTAGAPWEVDGTIGPLATPSIDLRGRAQADLSKTVAQWLPQAHSWRPEGAVQIVVIARGPLRQWPAIELMATSDVTGASLTVPGFPHRLERINAQLHYDHLARELRVHDLTSHALDHDFTIQGTVRLAASPSLEALIQTQGAMPMSAEMAVTDLTESPHVIGSVQFPQGSLQLDSRFHQDRVEIAHAELRLGQSQMRLAGRLGHANAPSELQLSGVVELADLTQVPVVNLKQPLEAWNLHGPVTLQAKLRGVAREWREMEMLGSGSARKVTVRDIPVQDLSVQWQQRAGVLMVKLVHATVGGGRAAGTWFAELHSDPVKLVADADLTNLDLAQMTMAIPTWKGRDIRGAASAHAEMSGFARDQASWRGAGWVNMSGEHLGELPLLDRVFQGVFGALAERLGLAHLRRAKLTKFSGQWRLAQARIWTDDLQLSGTAGAEPIIILIRGSVGLDKTLDLTVEPNLPEQLVLEAPNTSSLSRTILRVVGGAERMRQMVGRHHVGGSIDRPEYKFEFSLDQLLNQVLPAGLGQFLESVR